MSDFKKNNIEIFSYTISERSKNYVNDNPEIFKSAIYDYEYQDYIKHINYLEEEMKKKNFEIWKLENANKKQKKPRNLITAYLK